MLNLFFFCPLQFSPQRSGPSLVFICNCEVHKVNEYLSYITNSLTSLAMRSLYDFMVQLQIEAEASYDVINMATINRNCSLKL